MDKRLGEAATQVAQANSNDQERIRQELLAAWQVRLQDLLEEYPDTRDELRALTEEVQAQLPPAQQTWIQQNLARDQAVVYGVQGGNQYIQYYGAPGPTEPRLGAEAKQPPGGSRGLGDQ